MTRGDHGGGRLLAFAGVVGPAAFIAAWAVAGTLTPGYSSVHQAISRLAARGAPNRVLMTSGFVCFGVALVAYALVLRHHLAGPAWMAAVASGTATVGVALFPLATSSGTDSAHNGLAAIGYETLVAIPLLAARPLIEAGHRRAATASLLLGGLAGVCLAATLLGPAHGLAQRAGLALVDVWLMASALAIIVGSSSRALPRPQAQRSARN